LNSVLKADLFSWYNFSSARGLSMLDNISDGFMIVRFGEGLGYSACYPFSLSGKAL